jgi:hypothetical protein
MALIRIDELTPFAGPITGAEEIALAPGQVARKQDLTGLRTFFLPSSTEVQIVPFDTFSGSVQQALEDLNTKIDNTGGDALNVTFTPYLTITSGNVQGAIQELKDELDTAGGGSQTLQQVLDTGNDISSISSINILTNQSLSIGGNVFTQYTGSSISLNTSGFFHFLELNDGDGLRYTDGFAPGNKKGIRYVGADPTFDAGADPLTLASKAYVDAQSGGSTPGINDVLAVGQDLNALRIIELDGNEFRVEDSSQQTQHRFTSTLTRFRFNSGDSQYSFNNNGVSFESSSNGRFTIDSNGASIESDQQGAGIYALNTNNEVQIFAGTGGLNADINGQLAIGLNPNGNEKVQFGFDNGTQRAQLTSFISGATTQFGIQVNNTAGGNPAELEGRSDGTTNWAYLNSSEADFYVGGSGSLRNRFRDKNGAGTQTGIIYAADYTSDAGATPLSLTTKTYVDTAVASDKALKKSIKSISYGLDTVMKLKPKKFKWEKTGLDGIGFIAQDVESLIPEIIVDVSVDGYQERLKGVDYGKLTAILCKAIQEINERLKKIDK